MASSTEICTSCKTQRANPGYRWCESCYIKTRPGPAYLHCRHCGSSPNKGFDFCERCYKKDKITHTPRGRLCIICLTSWAETGIDLCTVCLASLDDPSRLLVNQVCNKCHKNPPNPGFLICEICFRKEQAMNKHGSFFNGIGQARLANPSYGGFRPTLPVGFSSNISTKFASPSESSSPEKDPRTLLNMGSTYVTTKYKKETKSSTDSDTDYYHCICPHCYSDTSRENLFYCTHCLLSVVQLGDNICTSCRNNLK